MQLKLPSIKLSKTMLSALLATVLSGLIFMGLNTAYQNAQIYINGHGMLKKYTFSPGLAHGRLNQAVMDDMMKVLSAHAGQSAYVYPVMVPHVYAMSGTRAMPRLASNDHVWLFSENPDLFKRLVDAVYTSKPDLLIRTNASALDKALAPLLSKEYQCTDRGFWVCQHKTP